MQAPPKQRAPFGQEVFALHGAVQTPASGVLPAVHVAIAFVTGAQTALSSRDVQSELLWQERVQSPQTQSMPFSQSLDD